MKKLTIERIFYAPINKVWEAFTNANILQKWWAPEGMDSSFVSVELKAGGLFRYCFKTEDGNEYWGRGIYQKIVQPTYISYMDSFTDAQGNDVAPSHYGIPGDEIIETLLEIKLSEMGDKTHMEIIGDNPFDDTMTADMTKGWNSMFDKLEKIL